MSRRAQAAFEFIILTGFMLLMFSLFFLVINERIAIENRKAFEKQLAIVTDIVEQEAQLANQVHVGYSRVFELPMRIDDEAYNLTLVPAITPSELIVNTTQFEYVVFLPFNLSTGSSLRPGRNVITKLNATEILITPVSS